MEIPAILKEHADYLELSAAQRKEFQQKLNYIEEVLEKIRSWVRETAHDQTAWEFFDDIELDIWSINSMGAGEPSKAVPSSWLIHSSWTAEISSSALRAGLTSDLVKAVDRRRPQIDATEHSLRLWLGVHAHALARLIKDFSEASTIERAMACCIAIDILLSDLQAVCGRVRLNRLIDRHAK